MGQTGSWQRGWCYVPTWLVRRREPGGLSSPGPDDCPEGARPRAACLRPGSSRKEGEPVGLHCSTRGGWAARPRWARAAVVAALLTALPLVVSAARSTAADAARGARDLQLAPAGDPARELAGLEAQAARLARQYRGEVVQLTDADQAAKAAVARVVRLRRELGQAHRDVARLAAAAYMAGVQDPAVAILGAGDPQRILQHSATIDYIARQRSAQQRSLERFMASEQRAEQDARDRVAGLRQVVAQLVSQRHKVA